MGQTADFEELQNTERLLPMATNSHSRPISDGQKRSNLKSYGTPPLLSTLHQCDLFISEAIERVYQLVDLLVGGIDLAL